MKWNLRGRTLRTALLVALCALFFLLAMGIVLFGSSAYQDVNRVSDENYVSRTALSYLLNQVRRADREDCVCVGSFGDGDALYLHEDEYVTILYCCNGQLRELYAEYTPELTPDDGIDLLPLSALHLELDGSLLSITASSENGTDYSAVVAPRCGLSREAGL